MRYCLIIIALVSLVFAGMLFVKMRFAQPKGDSLGGYFELVNHNGEAFSSKDVTTDVALFYFGFTNCTNTCPTDMLKITNLLKLLGDDSVNITPIFITVDPKRDTVEQMRSYLSNFHPQIVGLTGTEEQVVDVLGRFKIWHKKQESKDLSDYDISHSSYIYLTNRDGYYIKHFSPEMDFHQIAEEIKGFL